MIEGLRLLPWFQEAARRNSHAVEHLTDCDTCMQTRSVSTRQTMACGFAPPAPAGVAAAWSFEYGARHAPRATTCIGYLLRLPEVREIVYGWKHWEKGQLAIYAQGDPTELLVAGVGIFDDAAKSLQSWKSTPKNEGGGA